jgi:hypothetical protein
VYMSSIYFLRWPGCLPGNTIVNIGARGIVTYTSNKHGMFLQLCISYYLLEVLSCCISDTHLKSAYICFAVFEIRINQSNYRGSQRHSSDSSASSLSVVNDCSVKKKNVNKCTFDASGTPRILWASHHRPLVRHHFI